jgi:hypothetical protein
MNKITNSFLLYRECLRMTWNAFLRTYDDGEHELGDVNSALFSAMVLSQCENPQPEKPQLTEMSRSERYYDYLCVQPLSGPSGLRVLCAEVVDNSRKWTEKVLKTGSLDLRFSALFDFVTLDGCFREFRYVYAVVVRSDVVDIRAGEAVLVEANELDVLDISVRAPYIVPREQ